MSNITPQEHQNLPEELTGLLNRYSRENLSNTPDYILSKYLMGCLVGFEQAVRDREVYYGRLTREIGNIELEGQDAELSDKEEEVT